jgi:hypothetical protein
VRPKTLLKWIGGVLVGLTALVYAGDFVWFEFRIHNARPNDPLETVTFFYATGVKGGKVEVFYDQPQTQICVHSIFRHQGYKPCWRFNRSHVQLISRLITDAQKFVTGLHFVDCAAPGKGSALGAEAETAIERAPFLPTERTAKK